MYSRLSKVFGGASSANSDAKRFTGYSALEVSAPAKKKSQGSVLFTGVGTLYLKPSDSQQFSPLTDTDAAFVTLTDKGKDSSGKPQYLYSVFDEKEEDEALLSQPVGDALGMTFHHDSGAVMWHCIYEGQLRELCFRFSKRGEASRPFVECFNTCVYNSLADVGAKDDIADVEYIKNTFSQQQPIRDSSPEPTAASAGEAPKNADNFPTFSYTRCGSVTPSGAAVPKGMNVCFADSVQYKRAIVIRSNASGKVGEARAFSYDASGFGGAGEAFSLEEEMAGLSINANKDSQSLLGDGEKNFVVLHDKGGICDIDLTCGKVVAEYKHSSEAYKPIAITNRSKYAANDPNLICCLSNNVAYCVDKRLDPSKCVVAEEGKDTSDYALGSLRKPMTCHATSAVGHLVIGDSIGDLRLYSGPPGTSRGKDAHPKTAKTLLKGAPGKAIVSIDITADGKYVVAATDDALTLFPLEYIDAKGKAANGCEGRMGQNKKPPLRLALTAEQLLQVGGAPHFSTVRFDYSSSPSAAASGSAQFIVASCNNFVVTWPMASVVKALENNRLVAGDMVKEEEAVKQVGMREGETITYMTATTLGMERRDEKPKTRGFAYF